jgi:hypothetical protein
VQRELPPASRMKLPWESEPDKFNRGGVAIPEKAEQKPNMAKKSLSTDPADRAETALYDATSSLSKAKSSVSTAKEELERLKLKQAEMTKELLRIESKKAEKDNVFSFLSRVISNPTAVANQMQTIVSCFFDTKKTYSIHL